MRIQLIGLGNVGKSLAALLIEKKRFLKSLGVETKVVSVSDSKGTAIDPKGLDLKKVLRHKELDWEDFRHYVHGYCPLDAIRNIESDVVVELTPSTPSGEPGLSHIKTALMRKKNVVTANKTPLVLSYRSLMKLADDNRVKLLYEATVAGHLPIFCLVNSCFKTDKLLKIQGILNATTNFIIGQLEEGKDFQQSLDHAIRMGWTETNWSDDIDGIDAARKTVILANSLFKEDVKLEDIRVEGIRHVKDLIRRARKANRKVKLICETSKEKADLKLNVAPKMMSPHDLLSNVDKGDMGIKFTFETSREIFVSAQFLGPAQTAYAVLNDVAKAKPSVHHG